MNVAIKMGVAILVVVALYGCDNKPEAGCGSPTALDVTKSVVAKALVQKVTEDFTGNGKFKPAGIDESKIRALVGKLEITISAIRTTKKDPNSTKSFCAGTLGIGIPIEVLADADSSRATLGYNTSSAFAREAGVSFDANKIGNDFEYSIQPTDDGKQVFSEITTDQRPITVTATIASFSLLKQALEAAEAKKAAEKAEQDASAVRAQREAEAQQQQVEQAQKEQLELERDKAKNSADEANNRINIVWQSAPKAIRDQLLPEQRLWLKQREIDCKLKAAKEQPSDMVRQEQNRYSCEADMTDQRTEVLRNRVLQLQQQLPSSLAPTPSVPQPTAPVVTQTTPPLPAITQAEKSPEEICANRPNSISRNICLDRECLRPEKIKQEYCIMRNERKAFEQARQQAGSN